MLQFDFNMQQLFPDIGPHERLSIKAVHLYEQARRQGDRKRRFAWLKRRSSDLQDLGDIARRLITGQHAGVMRSVPLTQIRGSAGRSQDFDDEFYPLRDSTENRWVRIASAFLRGEQLPPIELVQVGDTYYVVDGHHRVSVLRMLHYSYVDAQVTVWETA